MGRDYLMDDKQEKAKQLRETLRNGRNRATDEASPTAGGDGQADDRSNGTSFQDDRRPHLRLSPTGGEPTKGYRRTHDDRRGPEAKLRRIGPADRRPQQSSGGAAVDPGENGREATKRSVGRIEASEDIPARDFKTEPEASFEAGQTDRPLPRFKEDYRKTKRKGQTVYLALSDGKQTLSETEYNQLAAKPQAASQPEQKETFTGQLKARFSQGRVLTAREAQELLEPLKEAIKDDGHYLDEAIWLRAPQVKDQEIWGNFDDDEAGLLAELWIKGGTKDPVMATTVRVTVELNSYLAAVAILAPRIHLTAKALREAPRREKKPLRLFRSATG